MSTMDSQLVRRNRLCCVPAGRACVGSPTCAAQIARASSMKAVARRRPGRGVGDEFVVAAAEVLDEGLARGDHGSRPEAFQAAHRTWPGLQPTMVGFDPIVGVLLGDVCCGRGQFIENPQVCAGSVGGHLDRRRPADQRGRRTGRVAAVSRCSHSSTSMTCPYWSTARYKYRHRPATLT